MSNDLNYAELMKLSKDIGKVDSRVSSIEAAVTASTNKQAEDMNYVHGRFQDVLNEMSKGFARIDKQHLELMQAARDMTAIAKDNERRLDENQPTLDFVEKWRQRWLAVLLTSIGLGGFVTWAATKMQIFKSFFK